MVMIVGPRSNYLLRAVPRLFYQAGADIVLAAPAGSSILSSRYLKRTVIFHSDTSDAVEVLERFVSDIKPEMLIVVEETMLDRLLSTDPENIPHISLHLRHFRALPIVRSGFYQWAVEQKIPVPEGAVIQNTSELLGLLAQYQSLFVKRDHSSGGKGVFAVTNELQADACMNQIPAGERVLVQRALGGIVGVTEMISYRGKLYAWTSSEKWRTIYANGPSVARRLCDVPAMEALARQVAACTNFDGMCAFDWVIDTLDGLPRLIEFHPRPASGYGIGCWAGVSYEKAIAALLQKDHAVYLPPRSELFRKKSVCCYFPDHILHCISKRDWKELTRWLPWSNARSWSMLPWHDPILLWEMLYRMFKLKKFDRYRSQ